MLLQPLHQLKYSSKFYRLDQVMVKTCLQGFFSVFRLPIASYCNEHRRCILAELPQALRIINRSLEEVRAKNDDLLGREIFSLADFIAGAQDDATLNAKSRGCNFEVKAVKATLALDADRGLLLAALANLLSNSFKFTHHHTLVTLSAYEYGNR